MAINDILRSALSTPVVTPDPVMPAPAQVAAPLPVDPNFYQAAAGRGNQAGAGTMSDLETDLRTLDSIDFRAKYGDDATRLILARGAGEAAFQRDNALNSRNVSMVLGDTVSGVGSGLANAFAGIGALGLGLANDEAGAWAAQKIQEGNEWVQSTQTDTLNARRRAAEAATALTNRDSTAQYEQEKSQIGEVPASLRRIGRDATTALVNGLSDETTFIQGTSDAVGSLLAAGPISKGLKAIGAPIASALGRAGSAAAGESTLATTASIAAMEAGGAYQQTAADVMGRSFEDLNKNSPQFRELVASGMSQEAARSQLANEAGRTAAAIQAPLAAATGSLVARFEASPFQVPNIRTALANALVKEPLEEGIQSGTGGLAQNYAIRENVDPTQSISEGVGEQVGQGALYGFSAAGTVQLPGAGAQGAVKAAKGTMQGLKAVTTPVFNGLIERGNRILAENEKNSPLADSVVGNAAAEAVQQAPQAYGEMTDAINALDIAPEEKAGAVSYVDSLMSQLQVDPAELDEIGYSENVRPLMANAGNRVEAMQNLADYVNRVKEDTSESLEAGYALLNMAQSLNDFKMREAAGLDALDPESRPAQLLNQYAGLLANIDTPKINRALNTVMQKMQQQEEGSISPEVTDANVDTHEGRQAVIEAVAVAENAPTKLNPGTVDQILYQESKGKLTLTPDQRAALQFSKTILSEQRKYNAEVERLGLNRKQDLVSKQITTDVARSGQGEKSALQHYKGIRSAVAAGNNNLAAALLADFGEFVRHMQNKVSALNTHFAAGNPNAEGVTYMALQPDRTWKESAKGLYVNTRSTKSLEQAHQIALEAQVLANVYNGLSDSFPDLNGGHVGAVSLDSRLDGPIREVADSFQRNSRVVDSAPTEVIAQPSEPAAEARADNTPAESETVVPEVTPSEETVTPVSEVAETPVADAQPDTETVAEAPITNKEWMKGDLRQIRPDDGRARIVDGATSLSYDRIDDTIKVNIIQTKKEGRGQGGARKVLTALVQMADEAGLPVSLDVAEQGDTDRARLIGFYESMGFVQQGDTDTMNRAVNGVVEEAPQLEGMDAVFPNLVATDKYPNHFKTAFSLPQEPRTRTISEDSPISMVQDALSSGPAFTRLTGDVARHDLTPEVTDGYGELFDHADWMKKDLNKKLQTFLTEKNVGGRFLSGQADANTWADGKLLNITDNNDGKLTYNQNLLENAVLAGLHWAINADTFSQNMDEESFQRYVGAPMDMISSDKIDALNQGMSTAEAKRSLAQKIQSYWGLNSNRNAPLGYVEGIPEAMAAEVIGSMIETGLMERVTVTLDERDGLDSVKTFDRWIVKDIPEGVKDYPNAIEHAVMVEPEEVNFIGDDMTLQVAKRQMNNPLVENTKDQQSALEKEQKTPFYINTAMVNVYRSMGMDMLQRLFGAGETNDRVFNKAHAASLEGKNRTIGAAFNSLFSVVGEVENLAGAQGIAVEQMPIRYRYNMSRVGRMQMLGKYTPQSSKLVREAILPTRSTVDLNDADQVGNFLIAAGQHFGVKVHNMARDTAITKINGMLETMAPAVDLLRSMNQGNHDFSVEDLNTLRDSFKAAGADLTPAALHSLSEYARIDDSNRGEFTTSLYLEADGMTNGPINAMALMSIGQFTQQWIDNMRKGGVTFGEEMSANTIRSEVDTKDLYQAATDETAKAVQSLRNALANDQYGTEQINRLFTVLDQFFGNDINFNPETGELTLGRGALKNPLTITIYGSGAAGIAGNITESLTKKIYERLTDALTARNDNPEISMADAMFPNDANAAEKLSAFGRAMNELTNTIPKVYDGNFDWVDGEPAGSFKIENLADFTFSKEQFQNLQQNILHLFVGPMREGIQATVGAPMMKAVEKLRRATQVQSIILESEFKKAVAARLEAKANADPNFKKTEFLSQAELGSIYKDLDSLAPIIDTGAQRFFIAGSNRTDVNASEFGRGLSSATRMSTPANIYGPADAGVAGAAFMTIGSGDGMMMQHLANAGLEGTLKVFDGMNIAIDQRMTEYSKRANEAVYQSWQGNPLKAVADSFNTFQQNLKEEMIDDDNLKALYRALGLKMAKGEVPMVSKVMTAIDELAQNMNWAGDSAARRIEARQSIANSVDQMAAAGAPYTNGKPVAADPLVALNAAYAPKAAAPEADPIMASLGREHSTGVRVLSYTSMQQFGRSEQMTDAQKIIFGEIQRSQAAKDWKIIYGTPEQIAAYQEQTGNIVTPADKQGATVIADKTIYLYNATPETAIHEMVHATTFEKVLAHYEGNSTPEVAEAIGRIEGLMEQFMADTSNDQAVTMAQAVITEAQSDLDVTDAVAKAKALNEFMAWALTNEQLTDNLKSKQAPSLVQMAKDVIKFLKQLFWGRKKAPYGGDDALSTLQFNTGVIIRSAPLVAQSLRDTALFQNQLFGNSDRLTELRQTFNKKIADYVRPRIDPNTGKSRRAELVDALRNSSAQVASVTAHGFPMTAQEAGTFRSLVTAMAMSIQLDPNALAKAQELYAHVTKTLKVEDFMPENPVDLLAARYYAQEQYNVIMGNYLTTKDAKGRSSLLPVFVALSMTNDQFRSVLAKMPLPKSVKDKSNTVDGMLNNAGHAAMDSLNSYLSGTRKSKNVGAAMDALMNQMYENAQDEQSFVDQYASKTGGILDRGNQYIIDGVTKLSESVMTRAETVAQSTSNKVIRALAQGTRIMAAMATEERGAQVAEGFMEMSNRANMWKPMHDFFNDLVGRTENNSTIYDMIKHVRSMVQQDRQQFREHLPTVIAKKFSRELTSKEWSQLHRGLGKTDLAVLGADGLKYMDDATRAAEITALESQISKETGAHFNLYQSKMKQLANYMMTGEAGYNLLSNAFAISRLLGEKKQGSWKIPQASVVDAMDKLTTLYAVEQLDPMVRFDLNNLITNESEGMDFSLAYLRGQRKDEYNKAKTTRAKFNQFKGYIPTLNQPGVTLLVADDREFASLTERSYVRVADYKGSFLERGASKKGYYYAPVSGRAAYNQGIFQNVRNTSNGVDSVTGFSHDTMVAGRITEKAQVDAITAAMTAYSNTGLARAKQAEPLRAIYSDKGVPIAYERMVDPQQTQRLNVDDHFAKMIGVWRGRQVEEAKAQFYNERLVDALYDMYERDTKASASAKNQYVDLFNQKDSVIKDAASLFSAETRNYISQKFGDEFYVRKDMLNDAIGYRSASTGDVFTGNTRWSKETQDTAKKLALGLFGNKAYSYITNAEKTLQNFVQDARTLIVVKSVIVPISNSIANVYQLVGRGVPLLSVAKGYPQKASEIDSYVKSRIRQIDAEAELRASTSLVQQRKLKAEIQSITDSHKRLSIWPLIEAGEFTAISDVGLTTDDIDLASGKLHAYIEKKTDQLPDGLKTAGRYALITKDTALYQGLQKAIQYGDFVAKAILYDDLTKRQKRSPEYALGRITEEFVNYDRLPGRFRGYLESIGLLWFWNFKIRSAKVGLSMIRNNPLHSLLAVAAPAPTMFGSVGLPIEDNLFAKLADGSLDYSVGVGQAMRAPLLNPWVNLVN
ncbi:DNA-directed RNA polymerase [Stenotrophomonas phage Piffle]|uniref:DNA-directed RNA polymerase n=1 Tax=Stenotrophomonas phage Piffle TaxID=2859656 RepID=A0AAE7WM88_9CAUD|nr:DNA-directed RNA polymerase [Stenotrophomonas phage Piffle]QYW01922.1 DNA-directed RNA polymerase [Stenotrophomonas phage Piffle]